MKVPLITYVMEPVDDSTVSLSFYVEDLQLLALELEKDFLPKDGKVSSLVLAQLLLTPHLYLEVLTDLVSFARSGQTSGPVWDSILARAESLLSPPPPTEEIRSSILTP